MFSKLRQSAVSVDLTVPHYFDSYFTHENRFHNIFELKIKCWNRICLFKHWSISSPATLIASVMAKISPHCVFSLFSVKKTPVLKLKTWLESQRITTQRSIRKLQAFRSLFYVFSLPPLLWVSLEMGLSYFWLAAEWRQPSTPFGFSTWQLQTSFSCYPQS